jgi:hypothetical protein
MKIYNIVLDTEKEKYIVIKLLRDNDIKITNIAGYFDGYIIHFLYNGNVQILDNKIQNAL